MPWYIEKDTIPCRIHQIVKDPIIGICYLLRDCSSELPSVLPLQLPPDWTAGNAAARPGHQQDDGHGRHHRAHRTDGDPALRGAGQATAQSWVSESCLALGLFLISCNIDFQVGQRQQFSLHSVK